MARKKTKLQEFAAHLFINEGWTITAIADYLKGEVTERSIGQWKRDGKWEDERARLLAAPHKIKSILLAELEKVSKGEKSNVDSDALRKIHIVIEGMEKDISPQVAMSVLKELDNWLLRDDPEYAIKAMDYHKRFIQHKINADG